MAAESLNSADVTHSAELIDVERDQKAVPSLLVQPQDHSAK